MKQRLAPVFTDPVVAGLLLLALGLRLLWLPERTLWYDEAYGTLISAHPLGDIWALAGNDVHPPFYYFCVHLAMAWFGDSLWAIRGVSVLAGTLTVLLAGYWVRLFASRRAMLVALLLLAMQPMAVRYSQEARMYALLALWLVAAGLLLSLWQRRPQHWRYPLLYALVTAAAMYTHYFAIMGLASFWAYALLTTRGRARLLRNPRWWLANLLAALLYLPWLPHLWQQLHMPEDLEWIPPLTLATVPTTLWEFFWILDKPLADLPPLWLLVPLLLGWSLWRLRGAQRGGDRHLLTLLALLPLASACLLCLIQPLFVARYLSFCAIPMVLLVALAIDAQWQRNARVAGLLLVVVCAVQAAGLANGYQYGELLDSPQGDRSGVGPLAEQIRQHWRPGDETVVYADDAYMSALYYLRHHPLPWYWLNQGGAPPDNDGDATLLYELPRPPWLWQYQQLPTGTCGVWLVYDAGDSPPLPPPGEWTVMLHRKVYDNEMQYFRRRSCGWTH
ncbi:glycosyltransferase family 39 protein [Pseudomonas sp. HR96]|uniref:glycosyltransferase family 39 protein n=1 Tax=Pseudomonas sp. HR96 TaxID=1027966 RepID=UPI002A756175|nr:glycosyltransferase family 39 protein [Pseudomonas sp. HR96]WPP02108.1 glycosyltransferase family 39 protein [Pseudomonas sp. HR96]